MHFLLPRRGPRHRVVTDVYARFGVSNIDDTAYTIYQQKIGEHEKITLMIDFHMFVNALCVYSVLSDPRLKLLVINYYTYYAKKSEINEY